MKKEELFAMFDALSAAIGFTPYDLEIYIGRKLGKTPLPLLYFYPEESRYNVINYILPEKKDHLVGILINENKTVLHLRAFTKDDAQLFYDPCYPTNTPSRQQVEAWVKKNFNQFLNPRPPREEECYLLENHVVRDTFEILDNRGIKVPKFCWECIGPLYTWQVSYNSGTDFVYDYLKNRGDLFILSDFEM